MVPHRPRLTRALRLAACALLAPALCLLGPGAAAAQYSPLSIEARGGAVLPTGGFSGDALAAAGPSYGLRFLYRRDRGGVLHLGFTQNRFACEGEACGGEEPWVATGWEVGTRVGLGSAGLRPWVRLAATFTRLQAPAAPASRTFDGDDGRLTHLALGGEAGLGLDVPLGGRIRLTPMVRYGLHDTRFPASDLLRVRYVVVDIGLATTF